VGPPAGNPGAAGAGSPALSAVGLISPGQPGRGPDQPRSAQAWAWSGTSDVPDQCCWPGGGCSPQWQPLDWRQLLGGRWRLLAMSAGCWPPAVAAVQVRLYVFVCASPMAAGDGCSAVAEGVTALWGAGSEGVDSCDCRMVCQGWRCRGMRAAVWVHCSARQQAGTAAGWSIVWPCMGGAVHLWLGSQHACVLRGGMGGRGGGEVVART
jgi:hypothetical protein